jgi:serine/threonine-protein kinase
VTRLVGGRYRLIATLGGGAVSEVSLAKADPPAKGAKLVVVKRLKLGNDADPEVATQFADEARVALLLDHPNIVRTLAANVDAEGPFLVLEYLEGQTLARIRSRASRRHGSMPLPIALNIVMAISTALAHAHAAQDENGKPLKIVHRDVSPENVVVTYTGETKLIDFSVAAAKTSQSKGREGATKGNIAYMAPEQTRSAVVVDERADVFAMGIVLWELLTGKRMWTGLSEADVIAKLGDEAPMPTVRSVTPEIPVELEEICDKALTKVRDERYDSAVDLRDAIAAATKKLGLSATTADVGELVSSLFEDEREKMKTVVDEAFATPPESGRDLPRVRPPAPSSSGKFSDVESDPKLAVAAEPAEPVRVEVVKVEQPSRDRRFTLVVIGAVLIAFAGVAVVALSNVGKGGLSEEEKNAAANTGTGRPRASVEVDAGVVPYVEPEEVMIEITVTPRNATLYVDGAKTPGSPYRTKVVKGKYIHEIKAEAEGYETHTMKVAFDKERTIELALVPVKPKPIFVPVPVQPRPPDSH